MTGSVPGKPLKATGLAPTCGLASARALPPQDAWTDSAGRLHLDAHQDYQLLQAHHTPEGLALLFKRPFSTCDPKDYTVEVGGAQPVSENRERFGRSMK